MLLDLSKLYYCSGMSCLIFRLRLCQKVIGKYAEQNAIIVANNSHVLFKHGEQIKFLQYWQSHAESQRANVLTGKMNSVLAP